MGPKITNVAMAKAGRQAVLLEREEEDEGRVKKLLPPSASLMANHNARRESRLQDA
jgi:hypothetical protein